MSGSMAASVPEMTCRHGWKSMWLRRRMRNMMSKMPWIRVYRTCRQKCGGTTGEQGVEHLGGNKHDMRVRAGEG